uniref:Telomerase activating protein Est1-like N-terminal domain-containing protein n=1 Tax=Anopheles minimus TaxID=112268 RepID=A0A182VSN4_9DIPT
MKNATVPPAVVSSSNASESSRGISNKRQQQIYSPGSGPLRKTEPTTNNRSHNSDQSEYQPWPRWTDDGSDTVVSGSNRVGSSSEVQQSLMDSSVSGSRAAGSVNWRLEGQSNPSNSHSTREEMIARNVIPNNVPINSRADRMQRDSRSVEPRFVSSSKKISIPSLSHLENLAPRLQKKTLQDLGLPQNYLEIKRAEYQQAMSQTLPNRNSSRQNRGRLRYSSGTGGSGNSASYSNAAYNTGRSIGVGRHMNDDYYPRPRSRSSEVDTVPERGYAPRRGQSNRDKRLEAGTSSRNSSCDRRDRSRGTPTGYGGDPNRGTRNRHYSTDSNSTMADMLSSEEINALVNDGVPPFKSTAQKKSFCRIHHNAVPIAADVILNHPTRENSSERAYARDYENRRGNYRDASSDRNYEAGGRFRRHSRDRYINRSRDNSLKREAGDRQYDEDYSDNWRCSSSNGVVPLVHKTDQAIAEMTKQFETSIGIQKAPGVLVIPTRLPSNIADPVEPECSGQVATKHLFDPKNPSQPIVVTRTISRTLPRDGSRRDETKDSSNYYYKIPGGPAWYNPDAPQAKLLRQKDLVYNVVNADAQLQEIIEQGNLFTEWDEYVAIRHRLQQLLETFLLKEMRFAQDVNLEHHLWRLLFYGIIEQLRKMLNETQDEERKRYLQERALEVVQSGSIYYEQLLALLEREYRFNLDQFIGVNAASSVKGLRYGLALVSAQKIFLFLGDLARYREQITGSHNFRKAKQWYVKAQQIMPKNGRPYNQLALLSVYAKRKIDAVYFYMRSLMSSNPFESARESLMDLFNETKKKRRGKEQRFDGNLRREIWIHPEGGSRLHRTGPIYPIGMGNTCNTSDEEELHSLSCIEVNKRFITSFLHVLGKLITKTGMESFNQCAYQMLREFRALMQYSPIAVTSYRLLQLMSLNMFAIEMTKLK